MTDRPPTDRPPTDTGPARKRRQRGFETAGALLREPIRSAGETRGFAVARVLTRWPEIVGPDIARICRPVRVGFPRRGGDGLGATLTLLTTGAEAPVLQMRLPEIREKVNACYGYNAIARIHVTQSAPEGFAEDRAAFAAAPGAPAAPAPGPTVKAAARRAAEGIGDVTLRSALEALAQNVLSRTRNAGPGTPDPDRKG